MKITTVTKTSGLIPINEFPTVFRTVTTVKGAPGIYGHVLDGGMPGEELASMISTIDDLNTLTENLFASKRIAQGISQLFPANGRTTHEGTVSVVPKQLHKVIRNVVGDIYCSEFISGICGFALSTAGLIDVAKPRLTPIARKSRIAKKAVLMGAVVSMEVLDVIKGTDFKLHMPARATVRNVIEDRLFTIMSTMGRMLAKRMVVISDTINEGLNIVRASLEEDCNLIQLEDRLDPSIAKNADLEKLTSDVAVVNAALTASGDHINLSNSRMREVLATLWNALTTAPWLSHESVAEFTSHYGTIRLYNNHNEVNGVIVYANYSHIQESPVGMLFEHAYSDIDTDHDYEIMSDQMSLTNGALDALLPDSPIKHVANQVAMLLPTMLYSNDHASIININLDEEEIRLYALLSGPIIKLVSSQGLLNAEGKEITRDDEYDGNSSSLRLATDVKVTETVVVDKALIADFAGTATLSGEDTPVAFLYRLDQDPKTTISIKNHNIPAEIMIRSVLTKVDEDNFVDLTAQHSFPFRLDSQEFKTKISLLQAVGVRTPMPRKIQVMLNKQYPIIVQTIVACFVKLEELRLELKADSKDAVGTAVSNDEVDTERGTNLRSEFDNLRISIAKEVFSFISTVGSSDKGKALRHALLQQMKSTSDKEVRQLLRYERHRRHLNVQLNMQVGMLVMSSLKLIEHKEREFISMMINENNIFALVS
jgi:hypothetical protein